MTNNSIHSRLTQSDFFSKFDDKYLDLLSKNAIEKQIEAGKVVFRQGERADKFYLVISGRISIEIPSVYGPSIEIQNLHAMQVLGWSWLISPYEWEFQAKVLEDATLLEFDGKALLALCENNPEFGYKLISNFASLMGRRLLAARQRMMDEWNPAGFA